MTILLQVDYGGVRRAGDVTHWQYGSRGATGHGLERLLLHLRHAQRGAGAGVRAAGDGGRAWAWPRPRSGCWAHAGTVRVLGMP
eukprot:449276-Hanusia_phi.AAC.1